MKRMVFLGLALMLGIVFSLTVTISVIAQAPVDTLLPPVTDTDGRAGACYTFYPGPQGQDRYYLPLAVDAGARWDRFDFSWPRLEPADNVWNFAPHDALVADLRNAGIENIVGILQMTPDWAATQCAPGRNLTVQQQSGDWYPPAPRPFLVPLNDERAHLLASPTWDTVESRTPPQGLYRDWTVGDFNGNQWAEFVYTVVSRYKQQVKHWEMWNEAEWNVFWCGTDQDYAQLLKVGYRATKAACPECTVLFAGLHYWADPTFFERVLDILNDDPAAPANNYFFDVLSVHFYSRSSAAYTLVNHLRERMQHYVPDRPVWLTETGVPVWGDPQAYNPKYDFSATQDEAAAYLMQSYANAIAAGVERYFFFRTNDVDMGEYFGLMRNDRSLRPAYSAYQVATTYLISPTATSRVVAGSNVRVTLWDTPHGKVSVLWNTGPTPSTYTLAAASPQITLVNRWGITQTRTSTDGAYTFTLPGATANLVSNPDDYIIGGDPLIVIEALPVATMRSLPAVTYTPAFTVAWGGQGDAPDVWRYDVEVRDDETGAWTLWQQATPLTAAVFSGAHGRTYEFRARAIDSLGNLGDWPPTPQARTTLYLASTLRFSAGPFFADENRGDREGTLTLILDEHILTGVSMHFVDSAGRNVVPPGVGNTWEFITMIRAGETYRLKLTATTPLTDYVRILPFTWPRGAEVYTVALGELGLWPVRRVYMPLVMRR